MPASPGNNEIDLFLLHQIGDGDVRRSDSDSGFDFQSVRSGVLNQLFQVDNSILPQLLLHDGVVVERAAELGCGWHDS